MVSIKFSLIFLFFSNIFIAPATGVLPPNAQDFELDNIPSVRYEFPSLIGKLKTIVDRFHCPRGWRHFGGSCYYLSNTLSTLTEANQTCNLLHSNRSNLMKIRNTVQLFYVVNILTKNNLSALMIEIDRNLLKEKRIAEIITNDQGQWQRQTDDFRRDQIKYHTLRRKLLDELNSIHLRISRRSKKLEQNLIHNDSERMEDIRAVCDEIDWNIIDRNSTVYMLTTSSRSNKTICSLSDVQSDLKSKHICEYVLDFCFANNVCGKHGCCVNTHSGFKCSCSFLYDGLRCERISEQGRQVIVCFIILLIIYGLSLKPTRFALIIVFKVCIGLCKRDRNRRRHQRNNDNNAEVVSREMTPMKKSGENRQTKTRQNIDQHPPTPPQETVQLISSRNHDLVENPNKPNLIRICLVSGLSISVLTSLLYSTTIIHFTSYKNNTTQLVAKCASLSKYPIEYLIFLPIALVLIIIFFWFIERENRCKNLCYGRPGLLPPIEPFRTTNRFTTAAVFGIIAFEILNMFDKLFSTVLNHGILVGAIQGAGVILVVGVRYYPILASLQLQNIIVRFLVCLYVIGDIFYIRIQVSCVGFLPLPRYYSPFEEVEIPMLLDKWFIIYGLIKNIPYFILFSCVYAELWVRFAYDSIYVPIKKKQRLWSASIVESDESVFAKYYVTKLFRRNVRSNQPIYSTKVDVNKMDDFEYEAELQTKANQSRVKKFFDSIYHWDDDFRFTTMTTYTYTVVIVFLYYLACTLVFLCLSRPTDHLSLIQYFIKTTFNTEFQEFSSMRSTIISSAVIAILLIAYHLFMAMKNYKKHKLELFKGIYMDIPSAANFRANTIASNSVHYCGFLVGHTACSFIIYFYLIFFILNVIRLILLPLPIPSIQLFLAIFVPILVIYLLIMTFISLVAKCLFIQHMEETLGLRSRKIYAILFYFIFFADCFVGIATCIFRLIKASIFNVIFMARLDFSLYGRPIEIFDLGFATYVSYLHMEVAHTNPIMLAFCYSIYDDIVQRRPKHGPDDEITSERQVKGTESVVVDTEDNNDERSMSANASTTATAGTEAERMPTASATIGHLLSPERACEFFKIKQQKRARFRWFLAYTIINNVSLFDLRKQAQIRLARLPIARSYLIDEQEDPSTSNSVDERSPQRPVKSYLGMRSPILHDTYAQQSDTPDNSYVFKFPSAVSQQSSIQTRSNRSNQNVGSQPAPKGSTKSKVKQSRNRPTN